MDFIWSPWYNEFSPGWYLYLMINYCGIQNFQTFKQKRLVWKIKIKLQCSNEVDTWFKLLSLVDKSQGFQKLGFHFIPDMMNNSDPLSHKNRYDWNIKTSGNFYWLWQMLLVHFTSISWSDLIVKVCCVGLITKVSKLKPNGVHWLVFLDKTLDFMLCA